MAKERIILGIDPGTTIMGFGIIKVINNKMIFLQLNELNLVKYKDHYLKLKLIYERTNELIETFHPDEIAIEAPFFGKNVQSMLKLGRAQGVAMAATLVKGLPIEEYSPREVKQSITGNGASSKEQVAKMLQTILKLKTLPMELDATDGIAVAICHYFQKNQMKNNTYNGWADFLKNNPKRSS